MKAKSVGQGGCHLTGEQMMFSSYWIPLSRFGLDVPLESWPYVSNSLDRTGITVDMDIWSKYDAVAQAPG